MLAQGEGGGGRDVLEGGEGGLKGGWLGLPLLLWSPPKAGQKIFSLKPLGAEAKFWLSASKIGKVGGRGRGVQGGIPPPPPTVYGRSNTSLGMGKTTPRDCRQLKKRSCTPLQSSPHNLNSYSLKHNKPREWIGFTKHYLCMILDHAHAIELQSGRIFLVAPGRRRERTVGSKKAWSASRRHEFGKPTCSLQRQ